MEKISSRKHVSTGVLFVIRKIKLSQKLHATRYLSICWVDKEQFSVSPLILAILYSF